MKAFNTVENPAIAEIIEKKSRFIAHIAPVDSEASARDFLDGVRAEHRMARHNVYAYIIREGGRVRYSDDGEPAQTAGMPVLQALQHAELSDVVVVVTRYFGGTLLGTGGLVRAYTQATQAAIDAASVARVSLCVDFELEIPYKLYDQLMHMARESGAKISKTDFGESVNLRYTVLSERAAQTRTQLEDLIRTSSAIYQSQAYPAVFDSK